MASPVLDASNTAISLGPEIINVFMNFFNQNFFKTFDRLADPAKGLFFALATLDIVIASLMNWGDEDLFKMLVKRFLKYGLIFYVICNFNYLMTQVINGCVAVGLFAGAPGTSTDIFRTGPSALQNLSFILQKGVAAAGRINNSDPSFFGVITGAIGGVVKTITDPGFLFSIIFKAIYGQFLSLLLIFSCAMIVINFFITYFEFYITGMLSLILIPFGANKYTSFIAQKALNAVIGFGVRIMILSFLLGMSIPLLGKLYLPTSLTLEEAAYMCIGSFALAILSWHAPKAVTQFLMHGSPSGSADGLVRGVTQTAMQIGGAIATAGASTAATGALKAMQAGTKVASTGAGVASNVANATGTAGNVGESSVSAPASTTPAPEQVGGTDSVQTGTGSPLMLPPGSGGGTGTPLMLPPGRETAAGTQKMLPPGNTPLALPPGSSESPATAGKSFGQSQEVSIESMTNRLQPVSLRSGVDDEE